MVKIGRAALSDFTCPDLSRPVLAVIMVFSIKTSGDKMSSGLKIILQFTQLFDEKRKKTF